MAKDYPHSLESERSVLAAALVSDKAWHDVSVVLTPAHFYRHAHGLIYGAMAALAEDAVAIDPVTLADRLSASGDLDEVGGPSYIMALLDERSRSANAEHYAKIVREKAVLRDLIKIGDEVAEIARDGEAVSKDVVEAALAKLAAVETASQGPRSADDLVAEHAAAAGSGDLPQVMETGYADLDGLVGGFRPGDFVIVAGRPSTGKTSWVLGMADHVAAREMPTAFFSIEMSNEAVASRLLSMRSGVEATRLERGTATDEEMTRIVDALNRQKVPLYIEDSSVSSVAQIGAWCQRLKNNGGISCAAVDYIQLLASGEEEIAGVARALKRLAKDLRMVLVGLSQLTRASAARRDRRPRLSDLRGSGALEQDCDMAVLLFREEMYKPTPENQGIAEAIVAKNRNGPVGMVRMQFEKTLMLFRDLARLL